jgi:hypothetical protein
MQWIIAELVKTKSKVDCRVSILVLDNWDLNLLVFFKFVVVACHTSAAIFKQRDYCFFYFVKLSLTFIFSDQLVKDGVSSWEHVKAHLNHPITI